ncbi:UNVERIFIED_CONTAM: Retrovirus-related Pol polyprotein from transposon TNT 1-94 [Sesamum latifolium]|uniref:Retrovirus-related Pol polyprotein from transposon TNT 1-94 n=1 Tax=Sesamum latifolium TaxID=2727402 RepID=A0AAW2XL36_9LAMI
MKKKSQGSARVKRAQLQALKRDFETLAMKDGESVTSYFARMVEICNRMRFHGEKMQDVTIVQKNLRSLTAKFKYVVCAIEESKDTDAICLDELKSSLLVHEQKMNRSTNSLIDEQALKASTDTLAQKTSMDEVEVEAKAGEIAKAEAEAKCRTDLSKEYGEKSNFAETAEKEVCLMTQCQGKESRKSVWYLDTTCSNHMHRDKSAFSNLDETYHDKVKLGDESRISIMGKGESQCSVTMHDDAWLWYFQYGHLNFGGLRILQQKNMVICLLKITPPVEVCEECMISKQHRNKFSNGEVMENKRDPRTAWNERKPAVGHFRIFRCIAYADIPDEKRKKLDDKAEKCVFLRVSETSKAYKLFNPLTKKIVIRRDVIFYEDNTWDWDGQRPCSIIFYSEAETHQPIDSVTKPSNTAPVTPKSPNAATESEHARRRPAWISDYEVTGINQIENPSTQFALFSDCDPTTFESTVKEEKWQNAMNDKIDAIERNDTWKLIDLPKGHKTIGVKWVYKTKLKENDKVDKYKAHLVAKGYKQKYRIDYTEIFSLVARHDTIRYMENPTEMHLLAAKRIVRYLQGTRDYGIFHRKGENPTLLGFTNSDYAGDQDNRRSTSGYVFMLGTGAIS